jgi:sulfide:quinone oxidoreductase
MDVLVMGAGRMSIDQVRFRLKKVYDRWGIIFKQARAISVHPEGDASTSRGCVTIEYTSEENRGDKEKVEYDFLVNATGP